MAMIRTILNFVAGVDRKTLESCPATDKMWAAHLGFSLCLSFVVVFGISFHATGYMIDDIGTRALAALVIALTVLMFDRALCQSDWFYQGSFWNGNPTPQSSTESQQSTSRFGRIAIRLGLSLGLAWVIAMFLELAIFSDTISDKIERDRIVANQPIFHKIEQYDAQLGAEVERRRAAVANLEGLLQAALNETPAADAAAMARNENIEQQIKALIGREAELRAEQRQIEQTVQRYAADMNAEELGQKNSPTNSGRPGAGPRYEFAKRQREIYQAQSVARDAEIGQLRAKSDELRVAQAKIAAEAEVSRDRERAAIVSKRDALQAQVNAGRAEIKQLEAERVASVEEFRRKAMAESYFQEKKDKADPLTRMAAYQELKNDPKDGSTFALFSWMTRFFIIFLEVVPVVAKIFFSPPSVYAAKIQSEVERERRRIELAAAEPLPPLEPTPVRINEPSIAKRLLQGLLKSADAAVSASAERARASREQPAPVAALRREVAPRRHAQVRHEAPPRREPPARRDPAPEPIAAPPQLATLEPVSTDRPPAPQAAQQPTIADLSATPPYKADRDIVRVYALDQQPSSPRQDDDDAPPPPVPGAGHAGNGFASLKYSLRYGVMQSP
jgi:hypothetical protein